MSLKNSLSVARSTHGIWINVMGCGDSQSSPSLKECFHKMLEEGHRHYVINLMYCHWMDSTFMGTITGLAQRLKRFHDGELRVVNVNKSNQELMQNLGLHQLFLIVPITQKPEQPPVSAIEELPLYKNRKGKDNFAKSRRQEVHEAVLSAHHSLIKVSSANQEKFQHVLDLME